MQKKAIKKWKRAKRIQSQKREVKIKVKTKATVRAKAKVKVKVKQKVMQYQTVKVLRQEAKWKKNRRK